MSLLLLLQGAATAVGPPDLFANATGYFAALTGHATAETVQDREYIPGGEGRQSFQPRPRRVHPVITARATATLVQLQGRARAVITPAVAHAGVEFAKPTPKLRPPEEEREFRILARTRGRLEPLQGEATGHSRILAAAGGPFEPLQGRARVRQTWPDDTAELACLMLMLDQEAA